MVKKLRLSFGSYLVAHRFIFKHNLWVYGIIPAIINGLLIVSILLSALSLSDSFKPIFNQWFNPEQAVYSQITTYILQFLVNLVLFILYFFIYKSLILVVLSPFLALLSEKVDALYTGRDFPFSWKQLFIDAWVGVKTSIRNLIIEMGLIIPCLLLGIFIPFLGVITPFVILFIESYFFGYSMMDYTNERKRMSFLERKRYISENKPLAFGTGLVFYLILLIPLIGIIFAPLYGIVAGTLTVLQNDNTKAPYAK